MVYFRVSEDEFQQFQRMCESVGARSISDLTRSAIHRMIQPLGDPSTQAANGSTQKLMVLETAVGNLDRKVQQLTDFMRSRDLNETRGERLPDRLDSLDMKVSNT